MGSHVPTGTLICRSRAHTSWKSSTLVAPQGGKAQITDVAASVTLCLNIYANASGQRSDSL